MKLNKILSAGAVCSVLFLNAQSQAANENISLSLAFDYNSHFISYGANVWGEDTEDIGDEFIFNPSAQVDITLTETSGLYFGVWADVNSIPGDDAVSVGGNIQEVDIWLGYYFSVDKFTFDFTVQQWYYADETEGIVDFTVSYDTMFSPYLKVHQRIEGVGDQNENTMFVLGGTLYETEYEDFTFSFPIEIAGNFAEYHVDDEDGFAYASIGASFSYALPISDAYGAWDLHGGLTYYYTDEDNIGNPDDSILTASFGVGVSF